MTVMAALLNFGVVDGITESLFMCLRIWIKPGF